VTGAFFRIRAQHDPAAGQRRPQRHHW
jgi:hypothetical protein